MLHNLMHAFAKATGWPIWRIVFRPKIYYEDASVQNRRIQGSAIVISNHTSIYDFAAMLFVFFGRTLRCQVAELIFRKPGIGTLMKAFGSVRVDRNSHDFSFLNASEQILHRGGVMEIYPESRIPLQGEARPLEFKPSAAYLALCTGVKVIPVYTNGAYFCREHTRIIIGTPIDPMEYYDENLSDKENIVRINEIFRERIISLEAKLIEKSGKK